MAHALIALGDQAFGGRGPNEAVAGPFAFVDEMSEDEAEEMLRRMKDG